MAKRYEIHPRVGVARLGNSPDEFYLAPEEVGGLPIACDHRGNARMEGNTPVYVEQFKDDVGRIKRQAAKFRIFEGGKEVKLSDKKVKKITWTVHIANKKPVWYTFSELQGDLNFGRENSYENQHVPVNNGDTTDPEARKKLMIDPGPRTISAPRRSRQPVEISRYTIPDGYEHGSFPPTSVGGQQIDVLGELRVDNDGNLVALGGFGNVTGSGDISSFRGASDYWDDIADGYVLATIEFESGETVDAEPAWLLVGSPKYAPQLVNITTLYDTMYDVAIRHLGADPKIYKDGAKTAKNFPKHNGYTPLDGYQPDYQVDFETQIRPIIQRMAEYRWVADVPYLTDFANPGFDLADPSSKNKANRKRYFSFFRVPVLPKDYAKWIDRVKNGPGQLFSEEGIPLMPLNSGDNSVTNQGPIYKFETLSATQYFFMNQWAEGKFKEPGRKRREKPYSARLDEASVGNCVGAPFSPGIETTWIVRNPRIYDGPFWLKVAHFEGSNDELELYYREHGLSTTADEGEGGGCEPGDLTKRMAIPWQADFHECTVQAPNITFGTVNQFADGTGIQVPPSFYVYWWPPQSPMHVVSGGGLSDRDLSTGDPFARELMASRQVLDAIVSGVGDPSMSAIIPAGQRVPYQRAILTTQDMIDSWNRLGFILDQGPEGYPYFVEQERNFQAFGQLAAMEQFTRQSAIKAQSK